MQMLKCASCSVTALIESRDTLLPQAVSHVLVFIFS